MPGTGSASPESPIRVMDSQEHRLQAALELLDHMDFVSEAWSVIDEWKEKGRVRDIQQKEAEVSVSDLSVADLLKESKNLPTYISKDRQRLAAAASPKKQSEIAVRLNLRERRLDLIRRRLQDELV